MSFFGELFRDGDDEKEPFCVLSFRQFVNLEQMLGKFAYSEIRPALAALEDLYRRQLISGELTAVRATLARHRECTRLMAEAEPDGPAN
jgi:hypothetical protein